MSTTPNRAYRIPDPADAIHPAVRDALMDIDADVDSLSGGVAAALADPGGNGIVVRTSLAVSVARSLANAAAGLTWTNGDGVAGNPTPVLANDLAAVEGLSTTGVVKRTGTDTWSAGSLVAGDIPDLSGTYQPLDSDLTTIAGLTATTDNFIVSVSSAWASRTPAQVRTTLGLVVGTNVQAWDADLDAIAGLSPVNDDIIQRKAGAWVNRTIAQYKADLALTNVTNDAQLKIASNLSDLADAATARTNIGLGIASTPRFARMGLGVDADSSILLTLAGTGQSFEATRFAAAGSAASFTLQKAAGSAGTPTTVADGTEIGAFNFSGYDGDSYEVTARIQSVVDGAVSNGVVPQSLLFVTGTTTANRATRLRITSVGNLKVAGTAVRGTTEGTNHIDIFNGTAPAGTLTNGISIYSASGIPTVMDASGNANGLGQTSSPTFAGLNVNGTIGASANLTIAPTGDVIFNPTGNDILPTTNYDLNLGSLSLKYLTLHAAELWVETLVAQDTIATIGGRILVGPTTVLTSDLTAVATTIVVKHNEMAVGDRIYMEAAGSVEFMAVTAGPTGTGPYSYTVTRNLDGSGANAWSAGDAVFNTGTTGDGFIDLYSVRGVKASSEAGPAIVGNVRNSATYNDWSTHWAIGNLNGLYGYGSTTYGVAFGKYAAGTPHITIDSTNGYRIFSGTATVIGQWDNSGNVTLGEVGASKVNTFISAGALSMRLNTTQYFGIDTSGNVTLGQVATDQGNAYWNNSNKRLEFRGSTAGTVVQAYVDTTGAITAGAGNVTLNSTGISITSDNANGTLENSVTWHDSSTTVGMIQAVYDNGGAPGTHSSQLRLTSFTKSTDTADGSFSVVVLTAQNDRDDVLTFNLLMGGSGTSLGSYVQLGVTGSTPFTGMVVGAISNPAAMLDVRGDMLATTFIRSSGATSGIGYTTGAGGTVTQLTSKATGVTLNKVSGHITMHNAALAAGAAVSFVVTDSAVATTDGIVAWIDSGGTANAYRADVTAVGAGSFTITVENITAGSLSEAPVIGFAIIKAVTS